ALGGALFDERQPALCRQCRRQRLRSRITALNHGLVPRDALVFLMGVDVGEDLFCDQALLDENIPEVTWLAVALLHLAFAEFSIRCGYARRSVVDSFGTRLRLCGWARDHGR